MGIKPKGREGEAVAWVQGQRRALNRVDRWHPDQSFSPSRQSEGHEFSVKILIVRRRNHDELTTRARLVGHRIPTNVRHAVMRGLAKDRDHRWQTAADFRRQLYSTESHPTIADDFDAEEESWFGRRGPYVLMLMFALATIKFYGDLMETVFTPELLYLWEDEATVGLIGVIVIILAVAALLDVLVRVATRLWRGDTTRQIIRFLFGQPTWWQTWYPRNLRVPDSVWDRLPFSMRLLRTLVWLQLIILAPGAVWYLFVVPTYEVMFSSLSMELPLSLRFFAVVITSASYALVVTLGLWVWQFQHWHRKHGLGRAAFIGSLFNLRGRYWQGSPARVMLKD